MRESERKRKKERANERNKDKIVLFFEDESRLVLNSTMREKMNRLPTILINFINALESERVREARDVHELNR